MNAYARNPGPGLFRYGSAKTVYSERLFNRRVLCGDLRANGIPVCDDHLDHATPSLGFEIDGMDMTYGWKLVSFNAQEAENTVLGTMTLENERVPVRLTVETLAGEEGFMQRTLRLTNLSDNPMRIGNIVPLRVKIFRAAHQNMTDALTHGMQDNTFTIGHFTSDVWSTEGDFHWDKLTPNTGLTFGSRNGRSGHNHPFLIAKDEVYGGYFLCQLAWSANWTATAYGHSGTGHNEDVTDLTIAIGPQSPNPARILSAGETFAFPSVVFGMNTNGFDDLVNGLQVFQRKHILRVRTPQQPIIINHWGYMRHELSEEKLKDAIDLGAAVGGELFIVDAGWFGNKGQNWWTTTGDWVAGDRLPNDLYPVFDYARSKGMKVGLWAEIESAGTESKLSREHPDWFLRRYGRQVNRQLDLTNPDVRSFIQDSVMELIERYKLDLFRLDYNCDAGEGGFHTADGLEENTLYRHVEAIWQIFDEVRARYPDIQLENCSSGGGRTDIGMASRFTTTWVSDHMLLPRTVRILNGMSIVLPPYLINRMTGASMEGSYPGSLEASLTATVMGHPSISGIAPSTDDINPDALETAAKYLDAYKTDIRPMHDDLRVYHHTPELAGVSGEGWCVLEYGTDDRNRSAVGVWRQYATQKSDYTLRLRGIDPSFSYLIRILPTEEVFEMSGSDLIHRGLEIHLDTALTSRLLLLKKV